MTKNDKAVDFNDPKALEEELTAVAAPKEAKAKKAPKKRAPKVIKVKAPAGSKPGDMFEHDIAEPRIVTITVPEGVKAGEEFDYTLPARRRGILAGLKLTDMTDDQLKIEYRNAKSVHYKQEKANGKATPKAQERLDNVVARMEEKGIAPGTRQAAASKTVDAEGIAGLIKAGKVSVEEIQALLDAPAEVK